MRHMDRTRLENIIENFKDISLLVVGDLMLDEFIWGKVSRISPEAPVPVVWVTSESTMPGGASNVANNVRSLGGKVYLAGIVGNDDRGNTLLEKLRGIGIDVEGVLCDDNRPTIVKTRVIAHHQQVVRFDREKEKDIGEEFIERMVCFAKKVIDTIDAVIIEDYGKGVIVPRLIKELIRLARRHKKVIVVDPKESHFSYYRNATAITPNHYEAAQAVGEKIKENVSLERIGNKLLKQLNCDTVLMTLGESGMYVFEKSGRKKKIPTVAQDVYDVSGAGDTVISTYALAIAAGAENIEAAHIANCAAGIVVGKVGIAVVCRDELVKKIDEVIAAQQKRGKR